MAGLSRRGCGVDMTWPYAGTGRTHPQAITPEIKSLAYIGAAASSEASSIPRAPFVPNLKRQPLAHLTSAVNVAQGCM
jgi:hypothetical protein